MEALGRLAGGVAHDFNNLLTIILGYSDMLLKAVPSGEFGQAARQITMAATRAAEMTQRLLSFSRRQVPRVEVLDLNKLISGLQQLLRRLIGEDIALDAILAPGLGSVEADHGQMEQMIINLAANARDAMLKGGHLEIRTANVVVDDRYLRIHPSSHLRYGPHVSVSVVDDGCGMDAETKARAFEPFFTSKPLGQGTGLGLSIVYGIITQAGGDVELSSEIGKGTRVEVLLPAVQKTLDMEPTTEDSLQPNGTETILVVEDEEGVRNMVRAALTRLGYTILECSDPSDAVALCDRYAGQIDLLLTDLIMPRMDGSELARRVMVSRPQIRVLYMSGYAIESFAKRGVRLPANVFLEKPFTTGILAERVREALARSNLSKLRKLSSQQSAETR
jgi:CheY-like chemotaxis protein